MAITYTTLPNSTFLDFNSYRSGAAPLSGGSAITRFTINVALVMDRASDPTPLLNADWASRQEQLQALNKKGTLWSTYGADVANYNQVISDLNGLGIKTVDQLYPQNGYVSTPESRTIWVQLNESNFTTLLGPGATLLSTTTPTGQQTDYWNGSLSLPDTLVNLGVKGLWFDSGKFSGVLPDPGGGTAANLPQGPQSSGNSTTSVTDLYPQQIAASFYNLPLSSDALTGPIGLVEPGVGTSLKSGTTGTFESLLNQYRAGAGISTPASVVAVAGGGMNYPDTTPGEFNPAGERSLDVGVVTAINPQSALVVYAGSGTTGHAEFNTFTGYQSAFWDTVHNPDVVTSSFNFTPQIAPGSPWDFAARELYIDAALRNISVFNDNGDGGSGDQFGNGLTNVQSSRASPFGVMVGGTSLATMQSALADSTLAQVTSRALAGDPATLWQLIAGGLTSLPSASNGAAALVETVWNQYFLNGTTIEQGPFAHGYIHNNTSSGGVDPSQPVPSYQQDFGLTPTTSDPQKLTGRGTPDVSALAGGDMHYLVPDATMTATTIGGGTSAATPLWAALTSRYNAIFRDQGLPPLGYMNDLLYIAASIAPASFNDVTIGDNVSSFTYGGSFTSDTFPITPTGYGYSAGPGYDLVTGLGTPNGELLGRALTWIAHRQMYFADEPSVIDSDGHGAWMSGADQTLLFQTMSQAGVHVGLDLGSDVSGFFSPASGGFAWTSRMAEQVLQPDFDPSLVVLFDKQGQGALTQATLASGEGLSVSMNGFGAQPIQEALTSPFGFAEFASGDAAVRVALPVAIAETAGGGNDETAIVRMRQDGVDSLTLALYRVDDLNGTIGTLHPGDPGYQAAVQSRAYQLATGGTSINGPGYGNFQETAVEHVNAGELVAMQLTNNTTGNVYSAFAQANEMVDGQHVGHLWNYGANTWGWEDLPGGGDRDYNDLVVQVDFTSASGHGWLK